MTSSIKPSIAPSQTVGTPNGVGPVSIFLGQADVCREQAREAARLKRYQSSLGLFATASALYRHVANHGDAADVLLANERLLSLGVEMATYSDLAHIAVRAAR